MGRRHRNHWGLEVQICTLTMVSELGLVFPHFEEIRILATAYNSGTQLLAGSRQVAHGKKERIKGNVEEARGKSGSLQREAQKPHPRSSSKVGIRMMQ